MLIISTGKHCSQTASLIAAALAAMVLLCLHIPSTLAQSAPETEKVPAIAFAARLVGDDNRARLLVDFDKKVDYEIYLLDDPKRLIVDLSETVFSLNPDAKRLSSPLVADIRQGTLEPGKSRIALDLAQSVVVEKKALRKVSSGNRHRLIIDLLKSSDADFLKVARKPVETFRPITVAPRITSGPKKFTVVLDPGHGGADGGAAGRRGAIEKEITLSFVKRLRTALEAEGRFNVVLTRENDSFVSLGSRLETARNVKADLMISVHADSLRQRSIRGATVYTLSERGSDALARALARKQNRADLVAGLELPKIDTDVTDILIDLTRRETEAFSKSFARIMVDQMATGIRLIGNPQRSADFFVLKAPEVPSVLLELGYLSNEEDEKLMQSEQWQAKVVELTKLAILGFFKPRMGQ